MMEIIRFTKEGAKHLTKPEKGCWISLISPTEKELSRIRSLTSAPMELLVSLKDMDEIPEFEKHPKFSFIIIKTPQYNPKEELEYTVMPLGIIMTRDHIMTVSFGRNDAIEGLRHRKFAGDNTTVLLNLLLLSSRLYMTYLKDINKKIYGARKDLEEYSRNEVILRLLDLQKSLVYFSTSLRTNGHLIYRLSGSRGLMSRKENVELMGDVMDENKQAIEMTNIYSEVLSGLVNAFSSVISNNLNMVMKLLTSVTIILMLPTLVASVYGMNVPLPFQDSPQAFAITMGISILLSVLGVLIFWRKELF